MIKKKLRITTVTYKVNGEERKQVFYGATNRHQYLRNLIRDYAGQDFEVLDTHYEEKNYIIDEEKFISVATEV